MSSLPGSLQIALAELLGDHAGLHDGEIEQIALQHQEAGAFHQRLVEGRDHLAVGRLSRPSRFSAMVCAGDGQAAAVELAGLQQFPHDRGHAAGAVEAFAEICARRLHIGREAGCR